MNIEDNQRRYNIISIGVATKGNQNKGVEEITRNSNSKNIFWKIKRCETMYWKDTSYQLSYPTPRHILGKYRL